MPLLVISKISPDKLTSMKIFCNSQFVGFIKRFVTFPSKKVTEPDVLQLAAVQKPTVIRVEVISISLPLNLHMQNKN